MFLPHGEGVLFERLGELPGVVALAALILYAARHSIWWGKRN